MRQRVQAALHPLSRLKLIESAAQSIVLRSRSATVQLSVIEDDLFRLRVVKGTKFSPLPSWAVAKTDWPAVPVKIRTGKSAVSLQAARGRLTFRLADGAWALADADGRKVFAAPAKATGFAGRQARTGSPRAISSRCSSMRRSTFAKHATARGCTRRRGAERSKGLPESTTRTRRRRARSSATGSSLMCCYKA